MYTEHWGLTQKPFENVPDPRFLYLSPQHEEGIARLRYAVGERKGAAVLTGTFGCGKTLLAHVLLNELGREVYRAALISQPQLDSIELLRAIARRLGATGLPEKRSEILVDVLLERIEERLERNMRDGKDSVIIIDEAHLIRDAGVLEQLRLLLNFQKEDRFMLTLLLLGQPELGEIIDGSKQLAQRIALACTLDPLGEEETGRYIRHRLRCAGGREDLFDPGALAAVQRASGGIPRRINQVCDLCLFNGFGKGADTVNLALVEEAVAGIGF